MILNPQGRKLVIFVIVAFIVILPSVFLVRWFDENMVNPRLWEDWTCLEMKEFALSHKDQKLNDFQRAKFHEDLSVCMR